MTETIVTARERFGAWLRARIEERRAGPRSLLAQRIGVAPQVLCDILAGRRQMPHYAYRACCRVLGILDTQVGQEGAKLLDEGYRSSGRPGSKAKAETRDQALELAAQIAAIRYELTSKGLIKIESKDYMRARGVQSPDRADAMMLAIGTPATRRTGSGFYNYG